MTLRRWRSVARAGYLRLLDAADLLTGARGPLQPPRSVNFVGNPRDFRAVGEHFRDALVHAGLRPADSVIDVGCGVGRVAVPLTGYLTTGTYLGIDIVPEAIRWCASQITPRHPTFQFVHLDVANAAYNPAGTQTASAVAFPVLEASFDFAVLTSVFTHMPPDPMRHYLEEIARVLRPAGRAYVTYFLWNPAARARLGQGVSRWEFAHPYGDAARVLDPALPERAIAHDEDAVRAAYAGAGLEIEAIRYGTWRDSKAAVTSQDAVIAIRR